MDQQNVMLPSKPRRSRKPLLIILPLVILLAAILFFFVFKAKKQPPTLRESIGQVTTLAGAGRPGSEDGQLLQATFSDPFGVAVDSKGNVYIADGGDSNRIRRINTQGVVETVAGSEEGFADGRRKRRSSTRRPPSLLMKTTISISPILRTTRFANSTAKVR